MATEDDRQDLRDGYQLVDSEVEEDECAVVWLGVKMTERELDQIEPRDLDPAGDYLHRDSEWIDGVRPAHVIETLRDIDCLFADAKAKRPELVCRYCGSRRQARSVHEGAAWFNGHECESAAAEFSRHALTTALAALRLSRKEAA